MLGVSMPQTLRRLFFLLGSLFSFCLKAEENKSELWRNSYEREYFAKLLPALGFAQSPDTEVLLQALQKVFQDPTQDPELRYLSARELAGYTEESTKRACKTFPPKADDFVYQAVCLRSQRETPYSERKKVILEIMRQVESAEAGTNLIAKTAPMLADISSSNNDNFLSLKLLERALQTNPKEDPAAFYYIKTQIAYLYTTPSNRTETIEKGLQYFAEAEAFSRKNQEHMDADLDLYNMAITYIFAFKDYQKALGILTRIRTDVLGLLVDKKVFSAFSLMKLGRHQEARQLLTEVDLSTYDDPSRIPFLACYSDIVRFATKDLADPKSCAKLPLDTQVDVVEHITFELSTYSLPEETEIALWRQYYRFYKEKIEPIHQSSFDQSANDLEVENARFEAALQKIEAEAQALKLEAERRQNLLTIVILVGVFLLTAMTLLVNSARRHSRKLEEAEQARTLFFHNTSHELRTPLNGIIGFLDLVSQGVYGDVSTGAKAQIRKALRLAESLKIQVNTILDLARSKRGDLSLKVQKFSLEELRTEADSLAEGLALKAEDVHYQSDFAGEPIDFLGDREKIFTVLRNLLGNAFKFRAHDRPNTVSFHLSQENSQLRIDVSDTGIGIPKEFQDKIFEEFGQVQGDARRHYEGTGLGLSLVKDLVTLMRGRIEVYSRPGVGSRFVVTIPRSQESELSPTSPLVSSKTHEISSLNPHDFGLAAFQPQVAGDAFGEGFDILVIDDNESNCEVITGILQVDGYHVRHAVSGRSGLTLMHNKRPHVLLLDMMMPEMSGEDVMREMKGDPQLQEIPIILITARASEEDRIEGLRLGADDYLPKPIFAAELRLRVKNMVERHSLLRQVERAVQEDKLLQLGELFSDLSHELKNVLQSSYGLRELTLDDGLLSSAILDMEDELRQNYARALVSTPKGLRDIDRNIPIVMASGEPSTFQKEIFSYLCEFDLHQDRILKIWTGLQGLEEDEQAYVASQMKVFSQYKVLHQNAVRSRDLAESVLTYARSHRGPMQTRLKDAWRQTEMLLHALLLRRMLRVEVELDTNLQANIAMGSLTQIFVNLTLNAMDAMASLPAEDRWLKISARYDTGLLVVDFQNGGRPIPKEVQRQLFKRGFSTKGEQGSGIGLFVSRRLATEAGGTLSYVASSPHPCFEIRLLTTESLEIIPA